ncbi:MAG: hypothetical protein NVS9B4_12710 [Candidatus Acidiferrum sp.]
MFAAISTLVANDKIGELQARFDRETTADGKTKALDKLAQAQFEEIRRAGKAGDYSRVGLVLEKYRDDVRVAFDLLKKQQPDADHHAGRYRLLEMNVRRGLRELDEDLLAAPTPYKPPIQIVRDDLGAIDDELIHLLFPRRSFLHTAEPPKPPAEKQKQP